MRPPHRPHARGEMRIEVAVKDRVANDLVAIAAAVVDHLQCVAGAGADHLTIEIACLIAVGRLQPLVGMLMMHVSHIPATVKNSELDVIVDVAVIDVRRIVGEERRRRLRRGVHRVRERAARSLASARRAVERRRCGTRRLKIGVRRSVNQHCRIADRPRAQEELFKPAIDAIAHRADADAVGVHLCPNAAGAVVDGERILTRFERRAHVAIGEDRKSLRGDRGQSAMINNRNFPIRLLPVRRGRVLTEERINCRPAGSSTPGCFRRCMGVLDCLVRWCQGIVPRSGR